MATFDLGIIGGGPAGYTTALYAAKQGKSVILFEKNELGGTCLNRGCIPTKLFLHAAEVYQEIKNSAKIGIYTENTRFDFEKIVEHKDITIQKLRKSLELMMKQAGITIVKSEAKVISDTVIESNKEQYSCEEIVLCTGSSPKEIKGLEFDHKFILNSDDILNLKQLPKSIVIVGSGAIGTEWARILSAFEVDVTLLEIAPQLVPLADWEVSKRIERQFKLSKIKFHTETSIKNIEGNKVTLSNGETLQTDCILVAAGRKCHCEAEGTSAEAIFNNKKLKIIGDAAGEIQLAHYATSQAKELVLNIPYRKDLIPSVIYGTPEIAWVGKTFKSKEEEEGYDKVVFPISALGKAHCDGCIDGFIKIVSKDNKIIGAHIISKEASALIQQIVIAMQNDITVDKLKEVCFAHPTYSEGIFEGIMQL